MTPLRILHLSGRPAWCGESNRVLVECRGLKARGHEVVLGTAPGTAIGERARTTGIEVIDEFRFSKGFRPHHTLHDARVLRELCRARPFDVVHLHTSRDTWPAALALGPRGRKGPLLVRTKHHSLPTHSNAVHRWLYGRRIDRLILASGNLRESIGELLKDGTLDDARLCAIHSSVNVTRFDPAKADGVRIRSEFGLSGRIVIGLIGRTSAEKGQAQFLDALERLAPEHPDITALIVGEGDQLEALKARVASSTLKGRVVFTGARNDIPDIVKSLDIQVVPSLWLEASPAVVKEAMAMNVPVIASRVGGVDEIIEDGVSGLLIPPGDVSALYAALKRLLDDPALRTRLGCGRHRVVDLFSDDRLVEASIAAYNAMLGRTA